MTQVLDAPDTDVAPIPTQIAEYSPVASALANLVHRYRGIVFDVTTTKGNAEARAARLELVKLRTGLEAKRQEIKAPALERSRLIDAEANRIKAAIAELEVPIDQQIRADEQRREAEKQKKIDDEAARVAEIRERISMIAAVAMRAAGQPSATIEEKIRLVVAIEVGPAFMEFADEAKAVHATTLASLREMLAAALASEAEAARIATERMELARLQAEDAARRKAEQEKADAERKAEDARLADERRKLEQEARTQREAQARLDAEAAAERRRADEEAARARAEADRVAREQLAEAERIARAARQAEQERLDQERAEVRRQQQEQDRVEREKREVALMEEGRAREAAAAAQDRLQAAAGQMLDALLLWRSVDTAQIARKSDAWKQAGQAREAAIAAAT